MATWQAVNVLTNAVELPKVGLFTVEEIWVASLGSTYANGDLVNGPVIPAGAYLSNVAIDSDALDSNVTPTAAIEVGYTNTGTTVAAAFIASGNTIVRAGGIASANVAGTIGFTNALDCTVQAKFTAGAATAAAGKIRFRVSYTTNP
jgi:hypothetical protein